jgi:hypothetical protein
VSVWKWLRGTSETFWQLGLGGPQWKNNAGAIEGRDPNDAAFVNVRGLDPVANQDFVTLAYFNAHPMGGQLIFSGMVAASETTTVAPYGDLATVGPSLTLTVPASGKILIRWGCNVGNGGAGDGTSGMAISMSGANVLAAVDANAILTQLPAGANPGDVQASPFTELEFTGLNPGVTNVTAKYRSSGGPAMAFSKRFMTITTL